MITEQMLCPVCIPNIEKQLDISRYMEHPPNEKNGDMQFILQHHWRMNSVHWDFRFALNDHSNGWTILDNPKTEKAPTSKSEAAHLANSINWDFKPKPGMDGKKLRAIEKARQPSEWMEVEGAVEPGSVGATRHGPGFFYIADSGTYTMGAQKPYFHEYFLHGERFKNLRLVVRAVRLARIDPETKRPIEGKYDFVWNAWIPEDQDPYAVSSRAKGENWKPPEGFVPIPKYWIESNKDKYDEWLDWMRGNTRKMLLKAQTRYTISRHKWMRLGRTGEPVGLRQIPHAEYFLFIEQNGVRAWRLSENPITVQRVAAAYEGKADQKWMKFEGTLKPGEGWNPNKILQSDMEILASGTVELTAERADLKEVLTIQPRSGSLKHALTLEQEERNSTMYVLSKSDLAKSEYDFVLHSHTWSGGSHFDIRIDRDRYIDEWSMEKDPRELGEEPTKALKKVCHDRSWMIFEGERKVEGISTHAKILDKGTVDIIDESDNFIHFRFDGKHLNGLYALARRGELWEFKRSKLPETEKAEEESTYIERPDSITVHLHEIRDFTSCESPQENIKYGLDAPSDAELRICAQSMAGALPEMKVQAIVFKKPPHTLEQVKTMDLSKYKTWSGTQVRGDKT
jgi:hypothetical protein